MRDTFLINQMIENVAKFLQQYPIHGTDNASLEEWMRGCECSWEILSNDFLTKEESSISSSIFTTFTSSYADFANLVASKTSKSTDTWSTKDRQLSVERLLSTPQIEQRTEAWYLDAAGLLSASQFNTILKSGRTRGQVVLQKASALPPDPTQRKNCVATKDLSAFTWGIRFEPIVKQIYQDLTKTRVVDLGRLRHPTDPRLAASPDGLVVEGPPECYGRFVEFKAPVTRKILSVVPEDYMAQMQIQMEVGGIEQCDYLEVKFNSAYGSKASKETENPIYQGLIYLIADRETNEPIRYEYTPLNDIIWKPINLNESEIILETIPWWCSEWFTTTVGRSRTWFASVQPAIKTFWEDVEKARQGQYELPVSKRQKKDPVCLITPEQKEESNKSLEEFCGIVEEP
jgi:hypothetical protein